MSKLSLHILHQEYLLTCPDGREDQLREAVERVDQQLQQMRSSTTLRSRERIGVLLAVNLAFENLELRDQLQALQQQLASVQGTGGTTATDLIAEQLNTLTAQAEHDQTIASALLQRLDQALAEVPPPSIPSTDLDNAERAALPTAPSETL